MQIIFILTIFSFFPKISPLACGSGYYLATPLTGDYCNSCNAFCMSCDGGQYNRCLSCFPDDSPSPTGRTCYTQTNYLQKIADFFDQYFSTTLPSYVTASLISSNVATCWDQSWVGGPAIFGNGDWIQITSDFPEKHYSLRIKFRFLKIDSWGGQDGQVYVDDVLQNIEVLRNIKATDGSVNYGNICGGGADPENIYIVDYTMQHSKNSVVIKITTNLDGLKTEKSWGIRALIIGIYTCDSSCTHGCSRGTSSDCIIPCWSTCATCTSILQTGCTSCNENYFLHTDGSCISQCLSPLWGDVDQRKCVDTCPILKQFGDSTDLRKCKSICPLPLYGVTSTNTCESACPSNFYKHEVDRICYAVCPSPYFGDSLTFKCVNPCPDGFYGDTVTKTCLFCFSSCYTCTNSLSTDCKLCYLHATNIGGKCICDETYYGVTKSCFLAQTCYECKSCYVGCSTCTGSLVNQCTKCISGYFLKNDGTCVTDCLAPNWGDSVARTCVTSCPNSNQYGDTNDHRICKNCDSPCVTCLDNSWKCTSCPSPLFLRGNNCYVTCPSPDYGIQTKNTCEADCLINQFKNDLDRICYENCPANYFADLSTKKCVSVCPIPYYAIKATNTCDSNCPANQFKHDNDRTCYATCPINFYGNPITGLCQNSCPNGMFYTPSNICEYCYFNCNTCKGTATFCVDCKYGWVLSGNSCIIPANFYQIDAQLTSSVSSTSLPVSNANSVSTITDCGPYHIFGGYNTFGMNTYISIKYTNVVPHYKIRITFFFIKIDNWNSNKVSVFLNTLANPESLVFSMTFTDEDSKATLFCGDTAKSEAVRPFDIYTDHGLPDIIIKISTDLGVSSSIASWGIFEFSVSLERCHETCKTCSGSSSTQCTSCYSQATLTINKNCICNTNYKAATVPANTCTTAICTTCDLTICHSDCTTCDGPSSTSCLSCSPPLFLNNKQCITICPAPLWGDPSSNKCESSCPKSQNPILRTCVDCDSNCLTCFGPSSSNCLTCNPPKLLWSSAPEFTCLDACPPPQVASPPLCVDCHPNCKTCDGATQNDCLSCPFYLFLQEKKCLSKCNDPYFGVNSTQRCELNCPKGSFQNLNTRVCDSCATQCQECIDDKICKSCFVGFFLDKGICVNSCSVKTFPNDQQKCEDCPENCQKCKNAISCDTCQLGYYLNTKYEKVQNCILCQEGGWKEEEICYFCGDMCVECEAKDRCRICQLGYGRKDGKCVKQVEVKGILKRDEIVSTRFHLKFDKNWESGFQNLARQMVGRINELNEYEYLIKISRNETDSNDFVIDVNLKVNIEEGKLMSITLNSLPTNEEFFIRIKEYSISLKEYYQCEVNEKFDSTTKRCIKYVIVSPSLEYTILSNELILRFDKEYNAYWRILPNNSKIEITDDIYFTYKFILIDSYKYKIIFDFNSSIISQPLCTLFFKVPADLKSDPNNSLSLAQEAVSLNLRDYYFLSQDLKDVISAAKEVTSQMNTIASTTVIANNLLSFGSSFAVTSLMSMESIRFLRYLQINYPPNVEKMFMSTLVLPGIVPNVNINEGTPEEEDIFLPFAFSKYDTNLYVFNNNGNIIIENGVYFLFACIVLFLNNVFSKTRNKLIKQLIGLLTAVFVWNFIISYYLGVLMNYIFFSLLYLKFPGTNTVGGYSNLGLAILEFIFIFLTLFYLTYKIIKIHYQVKAASHSNKIHPEILMDSSNKPESISSPKIITSKLNKKNEVNIEITDFFSEFSALPSSTRSPFPKQNKKINSSNERKITKQFKVTPSEMASSPEEALQQKKKIFSPSPWNEISSLPNPTIYGRKTHGKINPFEEAMTLNLKKTFSKLSHATSFWSGEQTGSFIDTRYSCLYEDLSHESLGQSLYLIFDVYRQLLIAIMIVSLFDFPIVALAVINIINFEMLVLLIFIRPLKKRIDFLHTSINEICVNVACWGSFALANLDDLNYKGQQLRMRIGWAIVGANGVLMGAVLVRFGYVLVKLMIWIMLLMVRKVREWREIKKKKNEKE